MNEVIEETLFLIKHRAKLLQRLRPEDVQDLKYVAKIGVEIEELIESLKEKYPKLH